MILRLSYLLYLIILLFLVGCSSNVKKINLDSHSVSFRRGYKDGCLTAKGIYTKNHKLFNDDFEYHEGWFGGRKECNQ